MSTINILFPVFNEERRLIRGVRQASDFCQKNFAGRYQFTIVDHGSTDGTETMGRAIARNYPHVHYIRLEENGLGLALRAGARDNTCDIVGYMDIGLSVGLKYLLDMEQAFRNGAIQIVNGSRLSKGSESLVGFSGFTARGFRGIMKLIFRMKIDDALCGFKFFRKKTIEELIPLCSNIPGRFYCAEILLRAERQGIPIQEISVVRQSDSASSVHDGKQALESMWQIIRLFFEFRRNRKQ